MYHEYYATKNSCNCKKCPPVEKCNCPKEPIEKCCWTKMPIIDVLEGCSSKMPMIDVLEGCSSKMTMRDVLEDCGSNNHVNKLDVLEGFVTRK